MGLNFYVSDFQAEDHIGDRSTFRLVMFEEKVVSGTSRYLGCLVALGSRFEGILTSLHTAQLDAFDCCEANYTATGESTMPDDRLSISPRNQGEWRAEGKIFKSGSNSWATEYTHQFSSLEDMSASSTCSPVKFGYALGRGSGVSMGTAETSTMISCPESLPLKVRLGFYTPHGIVCS